MKRSLRLSISILIYAAAILPVSVQGQERDDSKKAELTIGVDGRGDWAIALSGGGLRSSLFAVGALKALDEKGLVSPASAISTVSGGGYAGYWLYNIHNRQRASDARFGQSALSDPVFPQRVCSFMTLGNFVTYPQIASNFITFSSTNLYMKAIQRTYGGGDTVENPLLLSAFADDVTQRKIPEPIVNATIFKPAPTSRNHSVIEFSPSGIANSRLGMTKWTAVSEAKLPHYRLAAISGAAVSQLRQKIDNPFETIPDASKLTLWDGGRSENLGAYALIRRGVRNVIIIDAEHDPEYGFGAYYTLQNLLKADGIALSLPTLESSRGKRPEVSAFSGTATSAAGETRIYYVKMSLPNTLDTVLANEGAGSAGEAAQKAYAKALEDSDPNSGRWDCQRLSAAALPMKQWSAYNTGKYAAYLNNNDRTAAFSEILGINFLKLRFPHYSTADQSFYVDQARAFIGLGYLETSELTDAMKITS